MIQENLIRYKISNEELTEALKIKGDISFINNTHEGYIIIEVLVKEVLEGCFSDGVNTCSCSECIKDGA